MKRNCCRERDFSLVFHKRCLENIQAEVYTPRALILKRINMFSSCEKLQNLHSKKRCLFAMSTSPRRYRVYSHVCCYVYVVERHQRNDMKIKEKYLMPRAF